MSVYDLTHEEQNDLVKAFAKNAQKTLKDNSDIEKGLRDAVCLTFSQNHFSVYGRRATIDLPGFLLELKESANLFYLLDAQKPVDGKLIVSGQEYSLKRHIAMTLWKLAHGEATRMRVTKASIDSPKISKRSKSLMDSV